MIFVFGSDLVGRHGLTRDSYALPVKGDKMEMLCLTQITKHVDEFVAFATKNPAMDFLVTKIGCGLVGYKEDQIAPLFASAPNNCKLPEGWRKDNVNRVNLQSMFSTNAPF